MLQIGGSSHRLQHFTKWSVVSGHNVSAVLSAFGAGEGPLCRIPHIPKVVSAAHGERQLSQKKHLSHGGKGQLAAISMKNFPQDTFHSWRFYSLSGILNTIAGLTIEERI